MSDPQEGRKRLHFDPTISMGHIVQVVVILLPVVTWAVRLETRQAEVDVQLRAMQREMDRGEIVLNDKLRSMQNTLDRIETKLDQKADKPGGFRQ